jgi:hypothetical protein
MTPTETNLIILGALLTGLAAASIAEAIAEWRDRRARRRMDAAWLRRQDWRLEDHEGGRK